MRKNTNNRLWAASLIVPGMAGAVLFGTRLAGIALPDAAVRLLGAADLAVLPLLAFTTVRKRRDRKGKGERSRQDGGQ